MKKQFRILSIATAALLAVSPMTAFAEDQALPEATNDAIVAVLPEGEAPATPAPTVADVAADTAAPAAPVAPAVQVNGESLTFTDAQPVIQNDRVFIPFRSVFEALDATDITFDGATQAITATKEDTTITFTVGDPVITITTPEGSTTETTDAPSFIQNDRAYVPVRFAAQALGCTVGWDANTTTAILIDPEALQAPDATYAMLDRINAFAAPYAQENQSITGDMTMNLTDLTAEEAASLLTATAELNGLSSPTALELNGTVHMDLSTLLSDLTEEDMADASLSDLIDALEGFDFTFLMDLESGKMYLGSPLLETLGGMAANSYLEIDLAGLVNAAGMDWTSLLASTNTDTDSKTLMDQMINDLIDTIPTDNAIGAAASCEIIKMMPALFADSAFTETQTGYQSSYSYETDGVTSNYLLTVFGDENEITGYGITATVDSQGIMIMTMDVTQIGADTAMTMDMEIPDVMHMDMDMTMTYDATTQTPDIEPPANANIVSLATLTEMMITE